jgi:hypothetical protein
MHLDHANSSLFNMEYLDFGQVQFLREEIESRTGPLHLPLQHTASRVLEASVHDKGEVCTGVDMRERHSGRENRLDLLEIRDNNDCHEGGGDRSPGLGPHGQELL